MFAVVLFGFTLVARRLDRHSVSAPIAFTIAGYLLATYSDRFLDLPPDHEHAWITLRVHSSLLAVGLLAAVATRLAGAGIPCNPLAGFHHDHLLVPAERVAEAVELLRALQQREHAG